MKNFEHLFTQVVYDTPGVPAIDGNGDNVGVVVVSGRGSGSTAPPARPRPPDLWRQCRQARRRRSSQAVEDVWLFRDWRRGPQAPSLPNRLLARGKLHAGRRWVARALAAQAPTATSSGRTLLQAGLLDKLPAQAQLIRYRAGFFLSKIKGTWPKDCNFPTLKKPQATLFNTTHSIDQFCPDRFLTKYFTSVDPFSFSKLMDIGICQNFVAGSTLRVPLRWLPNTLLTNTNGLMGWLHSEIVSNIRLPCTAYRWGCMVNWNREKFIEFYCVAIPLDLKG